MSSLGWDESCDGTEAFDYGEISGIIPPIPEKFVCRPLRETDYEKKYLDLLKQLTVVGDVTRANFEKRVQLMKSLPQTYYIMVIEDLEKKLIVGSVTLVLEYKFIHALGSRGRIEDVIVNEEYRGKGFARSLIDLSVRLAIKKGVYKLSLECRPDLRLFYEKFGFTKDKQDFMVRRFD